MDNVYWTIGTTLFLLLILYACFGLLIPKAHSFEYKPNKALLTHAEAKYYKALVTSVNGHYLIFSKVRIADILTPKIARNKKNWWKAFTKISSKHVDFVLIDRQFNVVVAIELDDNSHQQKKRRQRDQFVNAAFQSAGVTLIRQPIKQRYQFDWLKELL